VGLVFIEQRRNRIPLAAVQREKGQEQEASRVRWQGLTSRVEAVAEGRSWILGGSEGEAPSGFASRLLEQMDRRRLGGEVRVHFR
jgi:hypothetical protein